MADSAVVVGDRFLEPDGLKACCRIRDYGGEAGDCRHSHDGFDEIVIVCSGTGEHETEQGRYAIGQGDVFLIPEGQTHGYGKLRNLRIANLLFRRAVLDREAGHLAETAGYDFFFRNAGRISEEFRFGNRLTLAGEALDRCLELCGRMQLEQNARRGAYQELVWCWFREICVAICRGFEEGDAGGRGGGVGDLCRLLRFMQRMHRDGELDVARLAAQSHRSASSLSRLFRRALDTSPMEYLNTLRLEAAALDLRNCDDPVSEIAFRHGFTDSNYFSSRFSARFGVPPRAYRKHSLLSGSSIPS